MPCAHIEPVSNFKLILLVLLVMQRRQKQSPEAEVQDLGSHTGRVEDRQASGTWQHPSCCGGIRLGLLEERWYPMALRDQL